MRADWEYLKERVADALEQPAAAREEFLRNACREPPELVQQALDLLRASTDADSFLEGAAEDLFESADPGLRGPADRLAAGTRLGDYEILGLLGEGGFSEVYRARQLGGLDREVALKRLKPGMDSRAILQRFEIEHRTLARLAHPHIARVLDAGSGPDGRPFVAMDLVEGEPLTAFATSHRLDLDQRLDLFAQVCEAVEHAHRRGVIHRDLKPSNLLVESGDGANARVQVIDFGIARLLDEGDGNPALTTEGMFVGTPAYASPEQLAGQVHDLDTRVDVYALGVILYELLTGVRPGDTEDGRPRSVEALRALLRDHGPTRPSMARSRDDTRALVRSRDLRGELDWITLRALEADRERRYSSVGALAADLQRARHGEPVEAGPPSLSYRLSRLARRHRALFAGAALALLALLGGGSAAVVGFVEARDAQQRAETAALAAETAREDAVALAEREGAARRDAEAALQEAGAVGDFLADLLTRARPGDRGQDVTVLELLDEADEAFDADPELGAFPGVEARLRNVIGNSQQQLGDFEAAETNLVRGEALARAEFGVEDPRHVQALLDLSELRHEQTRLDESDRLLDEAEEAARRSLPTDDPLRVRLLGMRARALLERGEMSAARAVMQRLLEVQERRNDLHEVITCLSNLAQICLKDGDPEASFRCSERAWRLAQQELDPTAPRSVAAGRSFGLALIGRDPDRAAEILTRTVEAATQRYGPEHFHTLGIRGYLAYCHQLRNRLDEAAAEYATLIPAQEQALGPNHRQTLMTLHNFGMVQLSGGSHEAARDTLAEALRRFREVRGPEHPETLSCEAHLLDARSHTEGPVAVAEEYERIVAEHDAAYGAGHPQARDVRGDWADHLLRLASALDDVEGISHDQVLATLQRALGIFEDLGARRGQLRALDWLVEACAAYGRNDEAARWRSRRAALEADRR